MGWREYVLCHVPQPTRDHMVEGHAAYGPLLKLVEEEATPLTLQKLQCGVDGVDGDLVYVASQVWGLTGRHMVDSQYNKRKQLAAGEEENGLELWRRLFRDHEGGAERVKSAGVQNLHAFPKCADVAHLTHWLGE